MDEKLQAIGISCITSIISSRTFLKQKFVINGEFQDAESVIHSSSLLFRLGLNEEESVR